MRRRLVVTLAVLATGCGGGVEGTAVPAPSGGLESVLLDDVQLDELLHASGFHSEPDGKEFTDELAKGARPPGCVHTVGIADRNVYQHAGPTAVLTRSSESSAASVDQSVVVVRSAEEAQGILGTSKLSWNVCAGYPVTSGGSAPATWRLEPVEVADGIPTQRATRSDRVGEECQHAMGVAATKVVEAMVCGPDVMNQAFEVVTKIVADADRS
ncbi:sensor domain-containing protein [Mycobacterium sp. PSTR-4-N]|uniref:sensor domain-containing protein n=1 Tax=Mycobacterium sp. PSTR-4-N TaxID=2917745 RepID=UPI001F14A6B1|nr:sensor domain-containing protein [Mycobacterium sp. PSTR-4-N]MCG7596246.1 sensor domain-containing protein [Mycobacterium sp. PSTR-4-N]